MKNKISAKSFFFGKAALLVLMLLFATTFVSAQTTTFAQFTESVGGQDFVFSNNIQNATFNTVSGGSPVKFTYLNVTGLPAALQGPQDAHVFVFATTTAPATTTGGNRTIQPFNSTFTIQILRDTAFNGSTNLLTAVINPSGVSNAELSGDQGATSAGFSASTPVQNVVFTSQFISFTGSTSRDLSLAFTSIRPIFTLGTNFVSSFTAAGTGSFATDQAPIFMIPTAATVAVRGQVLTPRGKGLANARVTLINSSGTTLTVMTDEFGNYEFSDVIAGDTVIIDVKSRFYSYTTQVINLSEDRNGLNFIPQYAKERTRIF